MSEEVKLNDNQLEKINGGSETNWLKAKDKYAGEEVNRFLNNSDIGKKFFVLDSNGWYIGQLERFCDNDLYMIFRILDNQNSNIGNRTQYKQQNWKQYIYYAK